MKSKLAILLAAVLALGLTGCAKQEQTDRPPRQDTEQAADPAQPQGMPEAREETWTYALRTETTETEYEADDGTTIAVESYEQPILTLVNESGEMFSGSSPERGVTAEQLSVCKAFNDMTGSTGLWDTDLKEQGLEIYEMRKEIGEDMPPVCNEVTVVSAEQRGDLLSVLASDYINLGGAHPDNGLHSWNFDLAKGESFSLMSLTDRPDELAQAVAYEVAAQIESSEYRDGCYEDWFDRLLEKKDLEACFGAEHMTVWFQEYELGPHVLGVPQFEIPYGTISRFLNAYGEQLLDLPVEARVIGDLHEAQELWSWLDGSIPVDPADSRTETIDGIEMYHFRVADPGVQTLADLSELLSRYVDRAFVDEELAENEMLREFDGVLYAAPAGRGDDLTIASVDYEAQMDASGERGRVIVTIHRQDYDDAAGGWVLTGVTDRHEFPFTLRDGHAVFDTMECIF